jgi:hypothetical protein
MNKRINNKNGNAFTQLQQTLDRTPNRTEILDRRIVPGERRAPGGRATPTEKEAIVADAQGELPAHQRVVSCGAERANQAILPSRTVSAPLMLPTGFGRAEGASQESCGARSQ